MNLMTNLVERICFQEDYFHNTRQVCCFNDISVAIVMPQFLVFDVKSYPEILLFCKAARIISESESQIIAEIIDLKIYVIIAERFALN